MEQLLLLLFLVFSVVSALLERRKRKQQLEEAQARQQESRDKGEVPPSPVIEDEDEEEWGGWPFPSADPFDRPQPQPVRRQAEIPTTAEGQVLLQDLQRQAREAEQQAATQTGVAVTRERDVRTVQPRRSVAELVAQRQESERSTGADRRSNRYKLSPAKARDAIVWAEILGPCKAEQQEEWRW